MTLFKLISKSLWYFRRQHIAVLAGTILSTAVLTGALIIGDSVKHSLRQMVDLRLGKSRYALATGDRFVRSQLASEIADKLDVSGAALLSVKGISINSENNSRINSTNIYGIDNNFWKFSEKKQTELSDNEAFISENLARKLNLTTDNEFLLRIENAEVIPLNAPFASQEQPSVSIRVKVKGILNENELGRFSIKSDQKAPYNVFVSRSILAKKMELEGLSNLLLFSDKSNQNLDNNNFNNAIKDLWQIEDASLKINKINNKGTYELVSDRIFIEQKIEKAIDTLKIKSNPVLSYLVNSISLNEKETPYSFVAAVNPPFIPYDLKDNEIVINSWLADDLEAKQGDSLNLSYFIIGPFRKLKEENKSFLVKEIIPIENTNSLKTLMPAFPGLSDAGQCRDWETGVPIDLDKIRDKDEDYWNIYKGTPKAYISISSGQKMWQNQFGNLTALRFDSAQITPSNLKEELIATLRPVDFNLIVQNVYEQGVAATKNAVDFGELFLSLSFFVIVAGILLTLLLHSLNTASRSQETGVLAALGFNSKLILKIRLGESLVIAVLGGILGAFAGIVYNYAVMAGLNSVWYDVVRTNMITVYLKPTTMIIGASSGTLISLLSIYLVSRAKFKHQIAQLVKNHLTNSYTKGQNKLFSQIIVVFSYLSMLALLVYSFATSVDNNSSLFLSAGALFLLGSTALVNLYFNKKEKKTNVLNINTLSLKNAGRNKSRSITTIVLLALGAYVILITGANRKTFYGEDNQNSSGTGGYLFWAETSLPILNNLNSQSGREKLGIDKNDLPQETTFMQFHSLDGNDASCLNLNQVQKPRILGIDASEFNKRNSFSFSNLLEGVNKENPWLSLNEIREQNLIPAVADQTVLTWGLKKAVGDTLTYLNEDGKEINLLIIGGLNNSIFQGNLLIANSLFVQNFPSVSGSKVMLIDATSADQEKISNYLTNRFTDYGIEINKASERLAEFNSVTNTYLAVFMALGGLGVLIGTIGLGIVLLRNMLERKSELALMTALGFTRTQLFKLVFKENLFLLLVGIVMGLLSAIIGILPSILSPSFEIPGSFVFIIIIVVLISGLAWIYFPTKYALKSIPVKALRKE